MHLYQKFISRHVAVIVVGSMVPCILAYATTPKPQTAITEMEIATQSEATQDESIIIEKNRKQAELKAMVLQLHRKKQQAPITGRSGLHTQRTCTCS